MLTIDKYQRSETERFYFINMLKGTVISSSSPLGKKHGRSFVITLSNIGIVIQVNIACHFTYGNFRAAAHFYWVNYIPFIAIETLQYRIVCDSRILPVERINIKPNPSILRISNAILGRNNDLIDMDLSSYVYRIRVSFSVTD